MTWEILIKDKDAEPFKKKLVEIAEYLMNDAGPAGNPGLMGGDIGLALFFFYYAKFTDDDKYAEYGVNLISDVFDAINDEEKPFTYHTHAGGLAGIGWCVEHLAQNGFLDADTDEILEALDSYIHRAMMYDIGSGNYDFLHGAVGNGTYFLSRLSNPKAKDYLIDLVDKLDEIAHREDDGAVKWLSVLNREEGNEGYNLSLSHGITAVIAFLGKVVEAGVCVEKASQLLEGAVKYLLKYRMDNWKETQLHFPSWVPLEGPVPEGSRLAWCYGDLGIGITLWHTAKSVGNSAWEKIAVEVLGSTATRVDMKKSGTVDAGLCHGTAGNMHIFNRAYQNTGIEAFKTTALFWAKATLELAVHEDGAAGYKAWHTEQYGGWKAEIAFLEGVAGIGLALISMLSDIESRWDRTLYIS